MTGVPRARDLRPASGWVVVLPVKELAVAKSRLAVAPAIRAALTVAMARDVAAAVRAAGAEVLLVTDDARAASSVPADWVEPDVPRAGLSAAARHGAAVAGRLRPAAGIVVLAADLPALTPAALLAVLAGVGAAGVVADTSAVGTVLLAATAGTTLRPAYEGASFAAHRAAGARDLTPLATAALRRDVDTVADLAAALALGAGRATTAAVAADAAAWKTAGLR